MQHKRSRKPGKNTPPRAAGNPPQGHGRDPKPAWRGPAAPKAPGSAPKPSRAWNAENRPPKPWERKERPNLPKAMARSTTPRPGSGKFAPGRSAPGSSWGHSAPPSRARLEELLANLAANSQIVDSTLADIEKLLLHSMLTNLDRVHLKAIEKEMRSQLREYKADMDEAAYKQTYDLLLAKRLRDEAGLPRLGLYYL